MVVTILALFYYPVPRAKAPQSLPHNWVLVRGLYFNDHNRETILFTVDHHHDNLNINPRTRTQNTTLSKSSQLLARSPAARGYSWPPQLGHQTQCQEIECCSCNVSPCGFWVKGLGGLGLPNLHLQDSCCRFQARTSTKPEILNPKPQKINFP